MSQVAESEEWSYLNEVVMRRYGNILKNAARCILERYIGKGKCEVFQDQEIDGIRKGLFVTLKKKSELRGCIGFVKPQTGLLESVEQAALLAATEDPRFVPVSPEELEDVEIEITVLGDQYRVDPTVDSELDVISLGRHGFIVESTFGRGLLLPQVALEWGFTKREFLEAACLKAGLTRDSWRDGKTKVFYFNAVNF